MKFANYLEPIVQELDQSVYAYFVTNDDALVDRLSDRDLPVLGFSSETSFSISNIIFCSYALYRFSVLMYNVETMLSALDLLKPQCSVVVEGNSPTDIIMSEASRFWIYLVFVFSKVGHPMCTADSEICVLLRCLSGVNVL